ncbi:2-C-methyl-D-erythritol 2,4-cyclodiphosphate synthase [Leptospirillum ferriphilum]|uniref:Bifunctional enzyme IspD/IspF n=1 Tax=Leptospirillum ferriphilum (strain ML-04) TaxID=1048260 RepID=J9ZBD6_LEPFM|nr:2-C-methyl-D-erythritol 2,4-cyclodiphosphate synthase [Leptospirillum ferriphilum]AFS53481.1 2-C-methyl-D-erythritol 4-phosphate cytidylyltransferase/2-C-methyl-D- erythritol2, 4- cyclodiphosphate synthase protein [Leptospirillum ferriphilum ML-04]
MKQRSIAVVMAAGGKGVRMGREKPKQFLLLDGRPLFLYSLETCLFHPKIGRVLLGVPREYLDETRRLIETYVTDPDAKTRVRIYEGGRRRQDTVALGVRLLEGDPKITSVMVHDAARPFLSGAILDRACDILRDGKSFGVGIPVSDTLWKRGDSSGHDLLSGIVEREKIVRAQTPQGSPVPVFLEALDRAGRSGDPDFTDEASLLLWAGTPVVIVPGEENNRKITTPEDLAWAEERILYEKGVSSMNGKNPGSPPPPPRWPRVGQGVDVHPFEKGRELWLGGIQIPHTHGLSGHSDADAVIHALCDALLGAVGEGDIGHHFPPSDERYRGQRSLFFLESVVTILRKKGYVPYQADLTIVAERPKISPHAGKMREMLAHALGVLPEDVSIKATTSEKMGFTGREEGLMALAVATVVPTGEKSGE